MHTSDYFKNHTLYAGDLVSEVTEIELFNLFSPVSNIKSIRICRDKICRKSLGYAYINFTSASDAKRALETLNFHLIRGKPVRLMWSKRDPALRKSNIGNLFVKNLPKNVDSKGFYDVFSVYGNISSCKLAIKNGQAKGFGYIQYFDAVSAENAQFYLDGIIWNGQKISIEQFLPKSERTSAKNPTIVASSSEQQNIMDLNLEQLNTFILNPSKMESRNVSTSARLSELSDVFVNYMGNDSISLENEQLLNFNDNTAGNDCISDREFYTRHENLSVHQSDQNINGITHGTEHVNMNTSWSGMYDSHKCICLLVPKTLSALYISLFANVLNLFHVL